MPACAHRRPHVLLLRLALLTGLLCPAASLAQQNARDLSGTVFNRQHEPLRGAVVEVHGESTGTVVSYITGRDGRFSFKRLQRDLDYSVWATWRGSRSRVRELSRTDDAAAKVLDLKISR